MQEPRCSGLWQDLHQHLWLSVVVDACAKSCTPLPVLHFREKFLQLLSSQPKAPMLLQESLEVTIRMDDLDTQIQLQQLQMRQGQETVGLKIQWEG